MDAELMKVGELLLPQRLIALIDAGLWPNTAVQARKLDHNCHVPNERIHLIAPEENQLYLAVPPFHTIAQRVSGDKSNFWSRFGALEQISPESCPSTSASSALVQIPPLCSITDTMTRAHLSFG